MTSGQLEVALLERSRPHRAFRRLTGARLDALLAEADIAGDRRGRLGQGCTPATADAGTARRRQPDAASNGEASGEPVTVDRPASLGTAATCGRAARRNGGRHQLGSS